MVVDDENYLKTEMEAWMCANQQQEQRNNYMKYKIGHISGSDRCNIYGTFDRPQGILPANIHR